MLRLAFITCGLMGQGGVLTCKTAAEYMNCFARQP
jgi:hypothetical protein